MKVINKWAILEEKIGTEDMKEIKKNEEEEKEKH